MGSIVKIILACEEQTVAVIITKIVKANAQCLS